MDRFHDLCLMLITAAALERLQRAETHAWTSARKARSEDQLSTLRGLIGAWIAENPDRTVVALVRFNEFSGVILIGLLILGLGLLRMVPQHIAGKRRVKTPEQNCTG